MISITPSADLALLVLILFLGVTFDFINGFHDTANAIATVVSTKVLTPRMAVVWAAIWNLVGALMGTAVAKTISSGLVEASAVNTTTILAALCAGILWASGELFGVLLALVVVAQWMAASERAASCSA